MHVAQEPQLRYGVRAGEGHWRAAARTASIFQATKRASFSKAPQRYAGTLNIDMVEFVLAKEQLEGSLSKFLMGRWALNYPGETFRFERNLDVGNNRAADRSKKEPVLRIRFVLDDHDSPFALVVKQRVFQRGHHDKKGHRNL